MEAPISVFIVVMMLLQTCFCEEPECSRFQYEEKLLEKLIRLEIGMDEIRQEMKLMDERVNHGLSLLQSEKQGFKEDIGQMKTGFGTVYVRWGKNTCPDGAALVYEGYIGGNKYSSEGSGSSHLCLPSDPTWSRYADGNNGGGGIYGTEIDTDDNNHIFDYAVYQQDMPCAVCRAPKSSTMMIPARKNCYTGWTQENNGFIMANLMTHKAQYNYICVDHQPDFIPYGGSNDNEHILYLVEAQCGSLPCPPYVQGRELACVVCSK